MRSLPFIFEGGVKEPEAFFYAAQQIELSSTTSTAPFQLPQRWRSRPLKMADEEVSLFLVVTFGRGPYWSGIYEIKFVTGGGGSNYPIVSPLLKAFENQERTYIPFGVGCDISGSEMRLVASCRDVHDVSVNFHQFKPYLFNTNTKESSEFQCPKTVKPFPIVIVVREKFYVLAGGTMVPSYNIQSPSFELLYPPESRESSSLPEFRMDTGLPIIVSGFAVIEDDCILISVYDFMFCNFKTEFFCYKIGSSMREWKSVGKEEEEGEEDVIYYPLFGKAAYVDHHVYTFGYQNLLMAYSVGLSADGIVQSLGAPIFFPPLPFLPLPPKSVPELGGGFAHLGSKIFCMMKTGSGVRHSNIQSVQSLNIQIVSILIGRVYGKMQFETLHALICALDMEENLGDANITSLCLDSQQSKYAYNADFWKGGPKVLPNKLFEEPYQPKPKSVPEGSQAARKRIDMHDLVDLTDDDLKDLGLPELRDTGMSQPVPVGALASALANATPTDQRTMLGENLYPLVDQLEPENAAKVTGMLLEMDQTEVLHLLESPEALKAKVAEAMEVLRNVTDQRTMLGENLYPLVDQLEPENAAKVTGMLLEMDQREVLHLLESPEALKAKVAEAMEVLRNVTDQRTMLGENLYPLVDQLKPENAAKLTGMLLEMDQREVLHLLESLEALKAKVEEAMEVLRNVAQQQQQASSPADQLASLSLNDGLVS